MRLLFLYAAAALALLADAKAPANDGARWWDHVRFLADDKLEGRAAGTPGHQAAAEYVAQQMQALGLKPGANGGWFQNVPFETKKIDESASSLALLRDGRRIEITLGKEAYFGLRNDPAPAVRAAMVFAGHGLQVPEMGYDDLKGLNLKGKIAVILTGAPAGWPGPISAHAQAADVRWAALKKAGAIGVASIPRTQNIPWPRASAARLLPQMSAKMPGREEEGGQLLSLTINPAHADLFLEGSGHTLKQLLDIAAKNEPLPKFPLTAELDAKMKVDRGAVDSPNVAGILEGRGKKKEYIVVSAHLDHLGKAQSFSGDGIFNGAMDNASGVAALLELARQLQAGPPLARSVLFLAVTGEEKGLQGSRYFAKLPTVPRKALVADCNMDMFLPLHELKALTLLGIDESTLGRHARAAAAQFGLPIFPDPIPEQNRFIRSDQYSFIREGIPSLAFKFGYEKGSPEEKLQTEWLRTRYHAVGDDLDQPVNIPAAGRFIDYLSELVRLTANAPARPAWNKDSFFRRFAK
jgi:hypothetical protein